MVATTTYARQADNPTVNGKALAWTIGVHVLLFLLFIILHYDIVNPPPPVDVGGGLEVNLGTSDNGSGNDQPMNRKAPAQYHATVVFKSAAEKSSIPKDIVRTEQPDAPVVTHTAVKKKGQEAVNEKGKVQEKPKYTYAGETGPGGNNAAQDRKGTNEGNTTGPGDRGVPGGSPGAASYSGIPGNGTGGIGHTLSGRTLSPDKFEAEFHESGKVVIHVTVDRNGEIVNKYIKSTTSPELTKIALEKLNNARFSKSTGPEPQQFGDVTIIFKTHQ